MNSGMMVQMVWYECWSCGVPFGMSEQRDHDYRRSGNSFHCIKGCKLRFGEGTVAKLERQLSASKLEATTLATLNRKAEARAAEFACPSCKRRYKTEQGLLRHMRNVHKQPLKLAEHAGPNAYNTKLSGL